MGRPPWEDLTPTEYAFMICGIEVTGTLPWATAGDGEGEDGMAPPEEFPGIVLGLVDRGWVTVHRLEHGTWSDGSPCLTYSEPLPRDEIPGILDDPATWDEASMDDTCAGAVTLSVTGAWRNLRLPWRRRISLRVRQRPIRVSPKEKTGVQLALAMVVCAFVSVIGLVSMAEGLQTHTDYSGAQRVGATVVEARYDETGGWSSHIVVFLGGVGGGGDRAIDDIGSAPDGLEPGSSTTVLVTPSRPGYALFPSQLGWAHVLLPGMYYTAAGLAGGISAVCFFAHKRSGRRTAGPLVG